MNTVLEHDSQIGSFAGKLPLRHSLARALAVFGVPAVTFHGADISHYQNDAGPLNWTALRDAGPWFACKATEGVSGVDPYFKFNRQQSRALKFTHRIWYHWLRPDSSPTLQARHFMDVVGELQPGEGIMLDVEQPGVTAAMVLEWCAEVWRLWAVFRRPVIIYTGAYVAGGTIWQSTKIRTSPFGRQPMHVAAYTSEARMRTLPGMTAYPPDGWQNSSNGPVPGVVRDKSVRCDMNHIFDWTAYNTACGVTNVPIPIPIPIPDPITGDDMTVQPAPFRAYDSRSPGSNRHGDDETFHVPIPSIPQGARGVMASITATEPVGNGVLTAWGDGGRPGTSNLNYAAGQTIANAALVPLTAEGGINVWTSRATHVIVDVQGWSS